VAINGTEHPENDLRFEKAGPVGLRPAGPQQEIHDFPDARSAVFFIFHGGRGAHRLAHVFLRQAHQPFPIRGGAPIKALDYQDGLLAKGFRPAFAGLDPEGIENLGAEPFVLDRGREVDPPVIMMPDWKFQDMRGRRGPARSRPSAVVKGERGFFLDARNGNPEILVVLMPTENRRAGFTGQMSLYLSAVDDLLRHPDDQPAIGLLLCKGQNKIVVEYALRGMASPIGVAEWQTQLTETLPQELKGSLPTVEEIEAELAGDLGGVDE